MMMPEVFPNKPIIIICDSKRSQYYGMMQALSIYAWKTKRLDHWGFSRYKLFIIMHLTTLM